MRSIALVVLAGCGSNAPPTTSSTQAATACGPGTQLSGGACVLSADHYALLGPTTVPANGQPVRFAAIGTRADGTPADDAVVIAMDRATAGSLSRSTAALVPTGATFYWTPCTDATCLGPVHLAVARASDPTQILAALDATVVDPQAVDPAAECLTTGTSRVVLHGNGDAAFLAGDLAIDGATWSVDTASRPTPTSFRGSATVPGGDTWHFELDATRMYDQILEVGKIYEDAQLESAGIFADQTKFAGGMFVGRNDLTCDSLSGRFAVEEITLTPDVIPWEFATFTAWFEQHCNGDAAISLTGCVRYVKP